MKYCHTKNDVPKNEHFAIIVFSSITIPGDERSRTNPGHGYSEHQESKAEYIAFTNRAEWEKEVETMSLQEGFYRRDFYAFVAKPASVTTEIKVKVS